MHCLGSTAATTPITAIRLSVTECPALLYLDIPHPFSQPQFPYFLLEAKLHCYLSHESDFEIFINNLWHFDGFCVAVWKPLDAFKIAYKHGVHNEVNNLVFQAFIEFKYKMIKNQTVIG